MAKVAEGSLSSAAFVPSAAGAVDHANGGSTPDKAARKKRKTHTQHSFNCWGHEMSRGSIARLCGEVLLSAGGGAFREHFCSRCRSGGVLIAASRIFIAPRGLKNRRTEGVWNECTPSATTPLPPHRVVNQTSDCTGPTLVVLRDEAPGAPLPGLIPLAASSAVSGTVLVEFRVGRTLTPVFPLPDWEGPGTSGSSLLETAGRAAEPPRLGAQPLLAPFTSLLQVQSQIQRTPSAAAADACAASALIGLASPPERRKGGAASSLASHGGAAPGYIPPADVQTARLGASGNGGLGSTPPPSPPEALAFLAVVFWVRSHSASYYDQEPRPSVPLWIARPGAFTLPFFAAAYLTQLASGNGRLAGHVWCAACILVPATAVATMFLRPAAAIESELLHHTSSSPLKFGVTFSLGLVHSAQPRSTSFKLLLAAALVALGSSILAVAYLRTGDGRWVRTVIHPLGLPFALPALLPHAIEAELWRGVTRALQRLRGDGRRRHRGGTHVER
ncbi:hypothetical protein EMIHUDRAFT_230499 [Emiliania huxleyi CCMP1516]|uniref:Mannosyltransferase n=2 Tax=Emiliania huxleyi TaxID=2903 RepID=A0A0D3KAC6_EMIH1|nr:hypothetical protein EMIHUDRAFT_230499 [Emiliania huxleyi CCMP1516]EOD32711.1 hypothetical protein EMIHUDRAFT_230499 [Emiliania huxleyi CCMP1516]|eukprot:XP_005785140.1 hypothetical protein EMIHUDRAFT_230499 [Emiliania huxleyi CCMP1516]